MGDGSDSNTSAGQLLVTNERASSLRSSQDLPPPLQREARLCNPGASMAGCPPTFEQMASPCYRKAAALWQRPFTSVGIAARRAAESPDLGSEDQIRARMRRIAIDSVMQRTARWFPSACAERRVSPMMVNAPNLFAPNQFRTPPWCAGEPKSFVAMGTSEPIPIHSAPKPAPWIGKCRPFLPNIC